MEQFDREKAQRVWQRVQGERNLPPVNVGPAKILQPNPEGLLLGELTDIRLLQQLSRGSREPALQQLILQAQNRASILKGICRLMSLAAPGELPKLDAREPAAALRRLMGGLLRRYREYRQLCDQEEFGVLYDSLAQQTQQSAALLARILGK